MKKIMLLLTIIAFLRLTGNTFGQTNWTLQTSGTSSDFHSVTWTGSLLVAGSLSGSYTSPDGITWTRHSFPSCCVRFLSWIGGQVIAVGDGVIFTSSDGITWTSRTSGTATQLTYAAWSGAQFIVLGSGTGSDSAVILTSPEGITWTTRYSKVLPSYFVYHNSLAMNDSLLIAVGGDTSGVLILTSPDGVNWSRQTPLWREILEDIFWTGSKFVAVGSNSFILTSLDGFSWSNPHIGAFGSNLVSIAGNSTLLETVGYNDYSGSGLILTSPDGSTWTNRSAGGNRLNVVKWFGNSFLAAGRNGSIVTSSDGVTWTNRTSGTTNELYSIAFTGNYYVVVGNGGTILTSPLDPVGIMPRHENVGFYNIPLKYSSGMFTYTLSSSEFVELGIYSVSGKKVAVLEQGHKSAGEHTAKSAKGMLPAGAYVYRFRAGSYEKNARVMIFNK